MLLGLGDGGDGDSDGGGDGGGGLGDGGGGLGALLALHVVCGTTFCKFGSEGFKSGI